MKFFRQIVSDYFQIRIENNHRIHSQIILDFVDDGRFLTCRTESMSNSITI